MSVNKVNSDGSLKRIAGGTLYADAPLGTILAFGGTSAPAGWMLCQGQALSRTTYAKLFAIIGTAFGTGDGSTTFNIPDLRGEFLRGAGTNSHSGQGNGGSVGQHQNATEVPNFIAANTQGIYAYKTSAEAFRGLNNLDKAFSATAQTSLSGGNSSASGTAYGTVRPTNTSVNYIIKAKMVALPADLDSAVDAKIAAKGVYSTSEVDTGKTWIDGKKIYKKVIEATLMSTAGTQTVAHGISNLAQVVNQWGMTTGDASGGMRQLDFCWYNDAKWDSCIYTDSTSVKIQMGEYYASYHGGRKAYIILEYTKTT